MDDIFYYPAILKFAVLHILPCLDSEEMAQSRKTELDVDRRFATSLGLSAVEAIQAGFYISKSGQKVIWKDAVEKTCAAKLSIPPDAALPEHQHTTFAKTIIQVCNETTLGAAFRLVGQGLKSLALNFANGVETGGGFLHGARAQEEVICRSSALYQTLLDDPMYEFHRKRPSPDSSDWAILSPDVPVFRLDDGTSLEQPWLFDVITCAAPYAPRVGKQESAQLLKQRIHRVLAIAQAYGYETLVLGAWGCGAFGNDSYQTACDFRSALENEFSGAFSNIVFAISDWSEERKFLGGFRTVFASE